MRFLLISFLLWGLVGCKPQRTATERTFREDLSNFRPVPPSTEADQPETRAPRAPDLSAAPSQHQTAEIDGLMQRLAEENRQVRYAEGYRIQVFVGTERSEAMALKDKLFQQYPDLSVYLTYSMPTFRIRMGDFTDRLEAQKHYVKLKKQYPSALLVEEQVNLQRN